MKDLQPDISNNFEHLVNRLLEQHKDSPGFPAMDSFGISHKQLDEYLSDHQAILDSEGSARSQQTLYGIIAVQPVIVLSAVPTQVMPWKNQTFTLLVGIGLGAVLALAIKGLRVMVRERRLRKHKEENPGEAAFADAVICYQSNS